ncbi:MAG: type II toxin-antitoxin system RelE/ParE family toxin [Bryobacter sp.]|nr:type II toxin-antitoxin system RelE/ParE family toxin [Bryobacter sp.]
MRPVIFHAAARKSIRAFPTDIRDRIGKTLLLLQLGESPGMPVARPMPAVAPGVSELRLRGVDGQFRVFYFTRSSEGILVPHAFHKKTRETPDAEIAVARRRLKELLDEAG